jgi:hypothetical protein
MSPHPFRCEIRVAESLESRWSQWFSDVEIVPTDEQSGPGTLLRGNLPDQAALFGLLGRVRDLNLTLVEVRRIDAQPGTGSPHS